mmetsp:Transcript_11720/g.34432  ORF Transcript_11720/g.34432 Transcript_11720/m.34432 type:complete len:640 (-) Transcript_11720:29-1948(-)
MYGGHHGMQSPPMHIAPPPSADLMHGTQTSAPTTSPDAVHIRSYAGGMPLTTAFGTNLSTAAPVPVPVPLAPALAHFQHQTAPQISVPAPLAPAPQTAPMPISVVAQGSHTLNLDVSVSPAIVAMNPINSSTTPCAMGIANGNRKRAMAGGVGVNTIGASQKDVGISHQIVQMGLGVAGPEGRRIQGVRTSVMPSSTSSVTASSGTVGKSPIAAVPSHMLSRRSSLGIALPENLAPTPSPAPVPASSPMITKAATTGPSIGKGPAAGESFQSAAVAVTAEVLNGMNCKIKSLPPQRRHSSADPPLGGLHAALTANAISDKSSSNLDQQQQVSKKRKIVSVHGGIVVDARLGMKRSSSMPSVLSPQAFLDSILKTRGYSTASYCSLETGYYSKPTPHQKASYGIALVRAVRSSDAAKFASMLSSGLSRNPCNAFGESVVHMVCRRGDHKLLEVLLDHGATLQVSDDFGRTPLHDACWTAEPCFECVDLVLSRDVRLLRVLDCRGSSPLSYVRKEHWSDWIDFLESRKDLYWKKRDVSEHGEEGPPMLAGISPNGRPVPDPDDALDLERAKAVSAGTMSPEDATRRREGGILREKFPANTVGGDINRGSKGQSGAAATATDTVVIANRGLVATNHILSAAG